MIFGTLGPNELSVIERCLYYRGVRKERLDCSWPREPQFSGRNWWSYKIISYFLFALNYPIYAVQLSNILKQ